MEQENNNGPQCWAQLPVLGEMCRTKRQVKQASSSTCTAWGAMCAGRPTQAQPQGGEGDTPRPSQTQPPSSWPARSAEGKSEVTKRITQRSGGKTGQCPMAVRLSGNLSRRGD